MAISCFLLQLSAPNILQQILNKRFRMNPVPVSSFDIGTSILVVIFLNQVKAPSCPNLSIEMITIKIRSLTKLFLPIEIRNHGMLLVIRHDGNRMRIKYIQTKQSNTTILLIRLACVIFHEFPCSINGMPQFDHIFSRASRGTPIFVMISTKKNDGT